MEELLVQLASLQMRARIRWKRQMRRELGRDWEPESDVWLTLEYDDPLWRCGFRAREDEATIWAMYAEASTPIEAVRAMIEDLT